MKTSQLLKVLIISQDLCLPRNHHTEDPVVEVNHSPSSTPAARTVTSATGLFIKVSFCLIKRHHAKAPFNKEIDGGPVRWT